MIDINTPNFPESVQDGSILVWRKQVGDSVTRDEILVEIETDKIVLEVPSPSDGNVIEIVRQVGDVVCSGELLAKIQEGNVVPDAIQQPVALPMETDSVTPNVSMASPAARKMIQENQVNPAEVAATGKNNRITHEDMVHHLQAKETILDVRFASPAARQMCLDNNIDTALIQSTGKGDRITKVDVEQYLLSPQTAAPAVSPIPAQIQKQPVADSSIRRVPMSRLRLRIAERLLEAKSQTAMLTTFNEVDMSNIMKIRNTYKDDFQKQFDTKLGFMSFFIRASTLALQKFPEVNAQIDREDIIYNDAQHIGVAVSSSRGLVVPVLRNVQDMGFADIEREIVGYGIKAREGALALEDLAGGTFTISNGGTFGSMLSTPILNPPQTAILGMHAIQDRAVVVQGEIVIRPMMYLALSYDHRLIDGKNAVQFLVTIKNMLEDPARIALGF